MKPIKGYEKQYRINKNGKILNLRTGKFMKIYKTNNGYMKVGLTKDGKQRMVSVHRLLAEAFIPNPENKPDINHKNGVKSDNRLINLEWCTQSENSIHMYKNGLKIITNDMKKAFVKRVAKFDENIAKEIRSLYKTGMYTQTELAKKFNMHQTNISYIVNLKTWK